jgi:hypothetical protein
MPGSGLQVVHDREEVNAPINIPLPVGAPAGIFVRTAELAGTRQAAYFGPEAFESVQSAGPQDGFESDGVMAFLECDPETAIIPCDDDQLPPDDPPFPVVQGSSSINNYSPVLVEFFSSTTSSRDVAILSVQGTSYAHGFWIATLTDTRPNDSVAVALALWDDPGCWFTQHGSHEALHMGDEWSDTSNADTAFHCV